MAKTKCRIVGQYGVYMVVGAKNSKPLLSIEFFSPEEAQEFVENHFDWEIIEDEQKRNGTGQASAAASL